MFTARTLTVTRRGLVGHPLPDHQRHVVFEDDGVTEVAQYSTLEAAQKIADSLNAYCAHPPAFGDRDAQLFDIINPP